MVNDLLPGIARYGSLIDFDQSTPELQVALERTDKAILVRLHWPAPESPYAAWFASPFERDGSSETDATERPRPPVRLLFKDSNGFVLLLGCQGAGYRSNLFGPGEGSIRAAYALLGVDRDIEFSSIVGMTSEIEGLRAWIGSRSIRVESPAPSAAPRRSVSVTAISAQEIELNVGGAIACSLNPDWLVSPRGDETIVTDMLKFVTKSLTGAPWEEHLEYHDAIRDLLELSEWGNVQRLVRSVSDPLDLVDFPGAGGPQPMWRPVTSSGQTPLERGRQSRHDLIEFNDLGPEGLRRWFRVRADFSRAIDPILLSNHLRNASGATHLATVGPGVEALGYLLLLRDGEEPRTAAGATLAQRLRRIVREVGDVLPFDGDDWVASTARTYNALKHANRALPDELEVINSWQSTVLIVRLWLANELGVPSAELKARASKDSLATAYVSRQSDGGLRRW